MIDARTRILEEAIRLFAKNGYGGTSVREVAEAAGITKPTLYYYFKSKEGLIRALMEAKFDTLDEMVQSAIAGPGSALDRIRMFLDTYLLGARHDMDTIRFMLTCSVPDASGETRRHLVSRHLQAVEPLAELIREGIAAGELRAGVDPRCAVLALVGAANLHLVGILDGATFIETRVSDVFDTWLNGVCS